MEENVTQDNNATGGPKKSKVKWIVAVVIAVIIIAAIANGGSDDDNDVKKVNSKGSTTTKVNSDSLQETVPQKTAFGIGETVECKNIQVTLEKVIISEGDNDIFAKPDDGKEFALCVFLIQNNSDKDISISSIANFEAYLDDASISQDYMGPQTEEGKKYNELTGDIASGKKMEGVISYEVPKGWNKLEVIVTPDIWSSDKITFVAENNR